MFECNVDFDHLFVGGHVPIGGPFTIYGLALLSRGYDRFPSELPLTLFVFQRLQYFFIYAVGKLPVSNMAAAM